MRASWYRARIDARGTYRNASGSTTAIVQLAGNLRENRAS